MPRFRILLLVAVAGLLVAPGSASAGSEQPSTCAPSRQVAVVLQISRVDTSRPTGTIYRQPVRGARRPLAEGDRLCAREIIVNPAKSGLAVEWRRGAQRQDPVLPGDSRTVNALDPGDHAAHFLGRFDGLFDRWGKDSGVSNVISRGACPYQPAGNPPARIAALPSWGKLVVSWTCIGSGTDLWLVTVTPGEGAQRVLEINENRLALDVAEYCPRGCRVDIRRQGAVAADVAFDIETRLSPPAGLPEWIGEVDDDLSVAARGAWLAGPEAPSEWRVQGASLLWRTGCRIPAAGAVAARLYGVTSLDDLCIDEPVSP